MAVAIECEQEETVEGSCQALCDVGVWVTAVPAQPRWGTGAFLRCAGAWDASNGWGTMDRRLFPPHWQMSKTEFLTIYFWYLFPLLSWVQNWWRGGQFEALVSSAGCLLILASSRGCGGRCVYVGRELFCYNRTKEQNLLLRVMMCMQW